MAFFGLTQLGYQNPIRDRMIVRARCDDAETNIGGEPPQSPQEQQEPLKYEDRCSVDLQPLPYSTDIHQGSHARYKEMVKRVQTPRSPNQLYTTPLTDSQQYGWMVSERPAKWMQVKRFPKKNSEMTKFVEEMTVTTREYSVF